MKSCPQTAQNGNPVAENRIVDVIPTQIGFPSVTMWKDAPNSGELKGHRSQKKSSPTRNPSNPYLNDLKWNYWFRGSFLRDPIPHIETHPIPQPQLHVMCQHPEALRSRNALGLFVAQPVAKKTAEEGQVGIVCKTHRPPSHCMSSHIIYI